MPGGAVMAWRKHAEIFPAPLREFREPEWPPVPGECLGAYTAAARATPLIASRPAALRARLLCAAGPGASGPAGSRGGGPPG